MTRLPACALLLSLLFVSFAGAQTPAIPTLKANTKIVVIDVVVTDRQGKPVRDLKASDFALAENGMLQTINHFDAHTSPAEVDASRAAGAAKQPEMPKLAPNVFTNYSPVPAADGPLNVLLLDKLNTPMQDQTHLNEEILKYLKSQTPGTRMAIFGLNDRLTLLQGFTSDGSVLKRAIENAKTGPHDSAMSNHAVTGALDPDEAMEDFIASAFGGTRHQVKQMFAAETEIKTEQQVQETLDALNGLARYLSAFPGRKNLMWFSGSFPISLLAEHGPGKAMLQTNLPMTTTENIANQYRSISIELGAQSGRGISHRRARTVYRPEYGCEPLGYGIHQAESDCASRVNGSGGSLQRYCEGRREDE